MAWEADVWCHSCHHSFVIHDAWETMNDLHSCPHCKKVWAMEYEETYNEDSGEETYWLACIEPPETQQNTQKHT